MFKHCLIFSLPAILLCWGCADPCYENTCDCLDQGTSLFVSFNTDTTTPNAFRKEELKNCMLIRYSVWQMRADMIDTQLLEIINRPYQSFEITNPGAITQAEYRNRYGYVIYNDSPRINKNIGQITVKGHQAGECTKCMCYKRDEMRILLDERYYFVNNGSYIINKE